MSEQHAANILADELDAADDFYAESSQYRNRTLIRHVRDASEMLRLIPVLEAEREELRFLEEDLLYWVERAVSKGNANSDVKEAWERYEAFLNKWNTAA